MVSSKFMEFRGLSTDAKPDETKDNVGNGASFLEIDTGKLYFYNADSAEWVEFQSDEVEDEDTIK